MTSRAAAQPAAGSPATPGAATDITIVSLAAVTWGFRLVGRTRMLTEAWRTLRQPTIFVQIPSYRTALERVLATFRAKEDAPVVRPWPVVPTRRWLRLGPEGMERVTRKRARALRGQLERHISWDRAVALVISPIWTPWLDQLPFRHVVYDCIDELAVHVKRPELAPLYRGWEDELIRRADGAVVTAESLGAALRARRADLPIRLIRNGVDADEFRRLAAITPAPTDLPRAGRPTIGFVGALYEWIDWELIRRTARALDHCDFVFVGPHDRRGAVERIASLPNVHLVGPRPYEQVPAYIAAFDVCWVPFRQDDVGRAANPVKIYEYLALGKPVVTTPIADTASFGGLIDVVRDANEAATALAARLDSPARGEAQRVLFAQQNTWHVRAHEYLDFIAGLTG